MPDSSLTLFWNYKKANKKEIPHNNGDTFYILLLIDKERKQVFLNPAYIQIKNIYQFEK